MSPSTDCTPRRAPARDMPSLLRDIRACQVCAAALPHTPRPVVRAAPTARILIIGQTPGAKVHASGIPWHDQSGERLRAWMHIDSATFYDESRIAIVPMGFCYPGKGKSGDLPPRPECAPLWHAPLLEYMPRIELTLLIGAYAQKSYLPERENTLTQTVRNWRAYAPQYIPLPHPSPRNQLWLRRNPWFAQDVLPALQARVGEALATD